MEESLPVAVIGGGPIGSLQAIFLAKRGFKVIVLESRSDVRKLENAAIGRRVNLALTSRGIETLKAVGCDRGVIALAVPIYGRMMHYANGDTLLQSYSENSQVIFSIDRLNLAKFLLNAAEAQPNVEILFDHKLVSADFDKQILSVKADQEEKSINVSFTFGCDGAYSTVRHQMMDQQRLNYQQEYIEHGYKELTMPPNEDGDYAMSGNYFHVWPRGEFMMVALPNLDKSFTLTLYMPYKYFDEMKTKESVLSFFAKHFPDSIDKLGPEQLVKEFFENPLSSFISIKCYPHYLGSRTLILGDAAHAVIPFFGVGLEDCLIFDQIFERDSNKSLHTTSQLYSETHWKDMHAVADLSMNNYFELLSHKADPLFRLKTILRNVLHWLFPHLFMPIPLITNFSSVPYHKVMEIRKKQEFVLKQGVKLVVFTLLGFGLYCLFRHFNISIKFVCYM